MMSNETNPWDNQNTEPWSEILHSTDPRTEQLADGTEVITYADPGVIVNYAADGTIIAEETL